MRLKLLPFGFLLLLLYSCNSRSTAPLPARDSTNNTTTSDEHTAINKTVQQVYSALVYKRASGFDSAAIKNLFIPQAQFIHFEDNDSIAIENRDQFLVWFKRLMKNNDIDSFIEEEVHGKSEQFGNLAERFSAYKTYVNTKDTVAQRGINSFQLVKTKDGWRVSSLTWDAQHEGVMLTPEYLTPDSAH